MTRTAGCAAAWLSLCACLPYAYVLPPLDVGADVGARGTTTAQLQVNVNVGTRPLSIAPSLHRRAVDFGLGYTISATPTPVVHGPYAELTYRLLEVQTGETQLWRLRGGGLGRLLFDGASGGLGGQGVLRVVFEFATLTDGPYSSSDRQGIGVGHRVGELGVGHYTEVGLLALPSSGHAWTASTGLMFTLPASFGVGLAWLR